MVTNKRKQTICKKYDLFLRVINILGNKMMLQKQFIEIAIEIGVVKDKFEAVKGLLELERAEIIKKIKFSGTSNKFILFKKYAIRYLANVNKSSKVAGLTRVNSNKRYIETVMKVQFILMIIIPSMKKRGLKVTLESLLKFIDDLNCNILYQANHIHKFHKKLLDKNDIYMDRHELEYDFKVLEYENRIRVNNLKGIDNLNAKKHRKNKQDYLYNSNISTLVRKNIFIANIKYSSEKNTTQIIGYYFNTSKDRNSYAVALNYSIFYNVMKRLFGININIKFKVITINEIIKSSLIEDLSKKGINPRTKEKRKDSYFIELLKENGLNEIDFGKMNIKVLTYNIE